MSYLGNQPGVSSQRTVLEEVVTGSPKSAFVPQGGYIKGYVDVLVNGTELDTSDFTAADGITINLTVAAAVGDTVKVKAWLPRGLSDGYLKSEADAKFAPLVNGNMLLAPNAGGNRVIGFASGTDTTLVIQGGGTSGSGANLELTRDYLAYLDANTTTFRSVDGASEYGKINSSGLGLGGSALSGGGSSKWLSLHGTNAGNYSGGIAYVHDGSTKGYHYYQNGYLVHQATSGIGHLFILNNGNKEIRFGTDGNIVMPAGAGIDFSGTADNGSSIASELLNDYEEGTWSPVIRATGGTTYVSFTAATAKYVKIGNQVTLYGYFYGMDFSQITNGTYVVIGGLPYSRKLGVYSTICFAYNNTNIASGYLETGDLIYLCDSGGNEFNQGSNNISGGRFMFSMTYYSA